MSVDEMIAVLQGYKEGRKVQSKRRGYEGGWKDVTIPSFDFDNYDYRLRPEPPEPRRFWLVMLPDDDTAKVCHSPKYTGHLARTVGAEEVIEVVEVLPT